MNPLVTIGQVPVNSAVIAGLFPAISGKNQKVSYLERRGDIVRLRKGLYVVSPELTGKPLSTELMANHIYGPSYVSMQSALRYYGLIPEAVYVMRSVTVKPSKSFRNTFGDFDYTFASRDYFSAGIRQVADDGVSFLIATPEKALCDLIIFTKGLNIRYKKEMAQYLEEDIRLDMDAFRGMDVDVFRRCAALGRKASAINTIIKMLGS